MALDKLRQYAAEQQAAVDASIDTMTAQKPTEAPVSVLNVNGTSIPPSAESVTEALQKRVAAVYKAQQQAIQATGQRSSELLQGIQRGEDIYKLFLQAIEIIGLMTGDTVIHKQAAEDIKTIYGVGLLEPYPLQLELSEIRQRLGKLTEATERADQPDDTLKRIYNAIAQHKTRERQIESLIERGEQT